MRELFGLGLVDEKSRIGDHHRLILSLKRGQKAKTNRQFCTPLAAGQSPSIKRIEDLPVTYTYFPTFLLVIMRRVFERAQDDALSRHFCLEFRVLFVVTRN